MKKIITIISLFFAIAVFAQPEIIPAARLKANTKKAAVLTGNSAIGLNTQFSKEEIEKAPSINLSDLLKHQQSVVRLTNTSNDPSQTALSLRGFGDNAAANSLILVDGFPLTNPSLLAPNFNSIPLTDIDRIEIFQGSEGSLWGNQAVGGVINIITKHPKKFSASGIISLGSYSTNYYNVYGANRFDAFYLKGFGIAGQTQHYRQHNRELDNNIATTLGYDYEHGSIALNTQTYSSETNFPGGLTAEQFKKNPQQASNFKNFSFYRTVLLQLLSKHAINDEIILESRLSHQETNGNGFVNLNFTRSEMTTSLNERLIADINRNKITTGLLAEADTYRLTNKSFDKRFATNEYDLYAQDRFSILPNLTITLGARTAWQNKSGHIFVTEQGLNYQYNDELSFYLRRDGNFSFPKTNEQTWLPNGLPSLKPQMGVSYETGLSFITAREQLQLGLYQLGLHDEIAFNPIQTTTQPFGAFNNLDPTRRYGSTITEKFQATPQLSFDTQLNYVNAKFAAGLYKGNWIPAVPTFNGNAGFQYAITDQWQVIYNVLYTGSRYASDDVKNIGRRLPGYFLHNLSIQFALKNILLGLEMNNVLNTQYPAYAFYNTFENSTTFYPAAGRNLLLTAKLNLD